MLNTDPTRTGIDSLEIDRQLAGLRDLKDGWADGTQPAAQWGDGFGKAPSHLGLEWLALQLNRQCPQHIPLPYLYPTPEGGVQAEWSLGANEASLEIDIDTRLAEWHCLNLHTDQATERSLDLSQPDSWQWIAKEIQGLEREAD